MVKRPELWAGYVEGVAASLKEFKAQTVFRGEHLAQLSGEDRSEKIVLISFLDEEEAMRWFKSSAYQDLIALRDKAAITNISLFRT